MGIAAGLPILHYIAKPLLLPMLMGWLLFSKAKSNGWKLLLAGLVFSWLGDIALLLEDKWPMLFIAGLGCFLLTHVIYIVYFLSIRSSAPSLLKKYPWLFIPVAAYGITLVTILYPSLGTLKVPVIAYATVICTMLICSLHIYPKLNRKSGCLFISGAVFFVVSDSLLAVNKFYESFSGAGVLIMLTYCLAQYCIVKACIHQQNIA